MDKQGRKCGSAEGDVKTDHISAKCHPTKPKLLRIKAMFCTMCKEEKEERDYLTSSISGHICNNKPFSKYKVHLTWMIMENKHSSCILIRR